MKTFTVHQHITTVDREILSEKYCVHVNVLSHPPKNLHCVLTKWHFNIHTHIVEECELSLYTTTSIEESVYREEPYVQQYMQV